MRINYQNDLVPSVLFRLIATSFVSQNDSISRRAYFYLLALKKNPCVFGKVLYRNFFENRITQSSIHCTVIENYFKLFLGKCQEICVPLDIWDATFSNLEGWGGGGGDVFTKIKQFLVCRKIQIKIAISYIFPNSFDLY